MDEPVIDAGSLDAATGLDLLLEHVLEPLAPGARIALRSASPLAAQDLGRLCKDSGHRLLSSQPSPHGLRFVIERGEAPSIGGGARPVRRAPVPDKADRRSGFAPRGSASETGGKPFDFEIADRVHGWAEEAPALYREAVSSQWAAERDIPWAALPFLPEPLDRAIAQVMTFLAESELSTLYLPAAHLGRIHPHYTEVVLFLATQMADEARHVETFTRRAEAGGGPMGYSTVASQLSLRTIREQLDFPAASFLSSVLGEGSFVELLKFIEDHAPDPVTAAVASRVRRDELRHVRFGVSLLKGLLAAVPSEAVRLRRIALERGKKLGRAGVKGGLVGANRHVYRSLCVLAAGGLDPSLLAQAIAQVAELETALQRQRIQRLLACGFDGLDAELISEAHSSNLM